MVRVWVFRRDENGAVSADFIVISGLIISMALLALMTITEGVVIYGNNLEQDVATATGLTTPPSILLD